MIAPSVPVDIYSRVDMLNQIFPPKEGEQKDRARKTRTEKKKDQEKEENLECESLK